ncbi:MAG: hypothetical protein OIF50_06400 [Flavobacteriaceae bacterium]|nr:hypothetical protein [Flavobacteriaceae bacterium]
MKGSCQQKSGILLHMSCNNREQLQCESCSKSVCEAHSHPLGGRNLCENCFWEQYLYYQSKNQTEEDTMIFIEFNSPSHSHTEEGESTFQGGFGDGSFSGGGASGTWTEGDMQSLHNEELAGSFLDHDDSFYYS